MQCTKVYKGALCLKKITPLWFCLYGLQEPIFLYIPLFVLVTFSFNSIAFPYRWQGFSLMWYQELFESSALWHAAFNSLQVAISAC